MNRKIYTANQDLALAEYCPAVDCSDHYACWQDPDTQNGYNYQMPCSPEEFRNRPIRSRFLAVIIRNEDNASLGIVSLSPKGPANKFPGTKRGSSIFQRPLSPLTKKAATKLPRQLPLSYGFVSLIMGSIWDSILSTSSNMALFVVPN